MIRHEKDERYDREAYEYAIEVDLVNRQRHDSQLQPEWAFHDSKANYLVKLEGPLDSAYKIHDLAGTLELPAVMRGVGGPPEKPASASSTAWR